MRATVNQKNAMITTLIRRVRKTCESIRNDIAKNKLDLKIKIGDTEYLLDKQMIRIMLSSDFGMNATVTDIFEGSNGSLQKKDYHWGVSELNKMYSDTLKFYPSTVLTFDRCKAQRINIISRVLFPSNNMAISDLSEVALMFGTFEIFSDRNNIAYDRTCTYAHILWLYVLIHNGYMDQYIKNPVDPLYKVKYAKLNTHGTFEEYIEWLKFVGIEADPLIHYVPLIEELYCSNIVYEEADKTGIDAINKEESTDSKEDENDENKEDNSENNTENSKDKKYEVQVRVTYLNEECRQNSIRAKWFKFISSVNEAVKTRAIKVIGEEKLNNTIEEIKDSLVVRMVNSCTDIDILYLLAFIKNRRKEEDYKYTCEQLVTLCLTAKDAINLTAVEHTEYMKLRLGDLDEIGRELTEIWDKYSDTVSGQLDSIREEIKKVRAQYEKERESNKQYRSKTKKYEKEINELRGQLDTQKSKNEKYLKHIDELKKQGIISSQPYKDEIDRLNEVLAVREAENSQLTGQLGRSQRAYNEMKTTNSMLVSRVDNLQTKVEELSSKDNDVNITADIPIDCLVNAIKNKKIAVFGGNMMHAELAKLGLKNLRLYEAQDRGIQSRDMQSQDVLVVVTTYMSHAQMPIIKDAAKHYDIPIINFNYKNVYLLVRELFFLFYGDKNKTLDEN